MKNKYLKKSKKRSKTQRYNKKQEKDQILLKYIKKLEEEIERYKKKSSKTKKKLHEKNPFKLILFLDMLKNKRKRQIENTKRHKIQNRTLKTNRKFINKKIQWKSNLLIQKLSKKKTPGKKQYLKKKIFKKKRKILKKINHCPNLKITTLKEDKNEERKIKFVFSNSDKIKFLKKTNFQIEDKFIYSKTSFQIKKLKSIKYKPKIEENSNLIIFPKPEVPKILRYSLRNPKMENYILKNSKISISIKNYKNPIPKINLNNQKYKLKKILLKKKFINWVKVIMIINYIKKKTFETSHHKLQICKNYYEKNYTKISKNISKNLTKEINHILLQINNSILCDLKKNATRLKLITTYNTYSVK